MLTKERTSKTRKFKYAAVALALLAVLVFCFASCGKATPTGIEYQSGTAQKVEYNQGEVFDCTGAKIKVTYDNGAVETVAVTPEMVGNAPLTLGTKSVSVTYSENGATVIGYIAVTVKDPYSQQKADAVAGLYANADVIANKTDKGVDLLVRDYTVKINEATSADAINTVKANFEAALDAYLGKKTDIIAKFASDADLVAKMGKLYAQFATDIATAMETAKANINAASTIDEAEAYFVAFVAAVDNKLAEQEVYEGDSENQGQIYDKIDLLELIEKYQARTALLKQIVIDALAADEIDQDAYDAAMSLATGYPFAEKRLSWWEKYITLAIDLTGLKDALDTEIGALLETGVDKAAVLLQAGTTIYPIAYKLDNGVYVNGEDVTGKLIADVNAYFDAAEDKFGATGLETLKKEYGVKSGVILIDKVLETITAKYTALNTIRSNGANIIDLIETAYATADGDAKKTAVDDAWTALKTWGTTNGVFSLDATIVDFNNNLVYDKNFDGVVYVADLYEDTFVSADNTWSAYENLVDETYVVTYFIPNLAKLIEATQAQDAYEAKKIVSEIPDIILSFTDADANAEITAAETALAEYKATYGDEIYAKYFIVDGVDETNDTVVAARAQYTKLVEMAAAANAAIDTYEAILAGANDGAGRLTIRSDYESAEAPLKKAYKLYCEFAAENTDSNGVIYTDVIENSAANTASNNETNLIAYMDAYVALAYAEERHVQSDKIINAAWLIREGNIPTDETAFRKLLTDCKQFYIDLISNDAQFNYKDTVEIEGETVTKSNFNYDALLKANIDMVKEAANTVADAIEVAIYDNGLIKIPDAENEGQFIVIYPAGI